MCPARRQPPPSMFLSWRQSTDLNMSLCFRYHCSPYQPNPSSYDSFSSHHRLCVVPEKAAEVHGCSCSLPAPTSASATEAAETGNLPNLGCAAADSSDSSTTLQQPRANSISEMRLELTITKELNAPTYAVFKPSQLLSSQIHSKSKGCVDTRKYIRTYTYVCAYLNNDTDIL